MGQRKRGRRGADDFKRHFIFRGPPWTTVAAHRRAATVAGEVAQKEGVSGAGKCPLSPCGVLGRATLFRFITRILTITCPLV